MCRTHFPRLRLRYKVDTQLLYSNPRLVQRFLQLSPDADAAAFIHTCLEAHYGWTWAWFANACLKPCLRCCVSHTNINGLLGTGQMHLLSAPYLFALLDHQIPTSSTLNSPSSSSSSSFNSSFLTPTSNPQTFQTKEANFGSPPRMHMDIEQSIQTFPTSSRYLNQLKASSTTPLSLLDVGAGSGRITALLAPYFDQVYATDVAGAMVNRLKTRGFHAVQTDNIATAFPKSKTFDIICFLNVLDRCSKPFTLLRDIRDRLRSRDSRVILATPLPLNPSVEDLSTTGKWVSPLEKLPTTYKGVCPYCDKSPNAFEKALLILEEAIAIRTGFQVEAVTRVPYLSQGDAHKPLYQLDDVIMVLSYDPSHPPQIDPNRSILSPEPAADNHNNPSLKSERSRGSFGLGPTQLELDHVYSDSELEGMPELVELNVREREREKVKNHATVNNDSSQGHSGAVSSDNRAKLE